MRVLLLAPVAVATMLAPGCAGASKLDTREVERALVADFVALEGVATEGAECPNQVDRGVGGSFTCTVVVDDQALDVTVIQTDDDGSVRFDQQQLVLDSIEVSDGVASAMGRELGQPVTATCGPSRVIVTDPGTPFECEVLDENGSSLTVSATADQDGQIDVAPA